MISYIMPVYNVDSRLLEESIASVLDVAPDVEIVLIDDGSTNSSTLQVLEALEGRENRARVFRQANAGVAAARNRGIREARLEWISFIDPDDRCRPLSGDVWTLLDTTAHNLVITAAVGITLLGREVERYRLDHLVGDRLGVEITEEMMALYLHGRHSASFVLGVPWAKFVRRSFLIEREVYFSEGMVKRSDAEWLIRLYGSVHAVAVLNTATVDYRIDVPGNISRRFRPEILTAYGRLACTAAAAPVSAKTKELYSIELLKDAINSVFTNPSAPPTQIGRDQYQAFRKQFTLRQPLLLDGTLKKSSPPRKILYLIIRRRCFLPIRALRFWKRFRATRQL